MNFISQLLLKIIKITELIQQDRTPGFERGYRQQEKSYRAAQKTQVVVIRQRVSASS